MIPLSVYIHWPWCIKKCPYCDFNSYKLQSEDAELFYLNALKKSLNRVTEEVSGREVTTVYIGGGTPSLLSPAAIEEILSAVRKNLSLPSSVEISMEANPGTFEYEKFKDFKRAGINRLSIGIQSFNDEKLKILGRVHNSKDAKKAAEAAAEIFENFNLDLMFALPGQTMEELTEDLETALSFGSTHLSYYQLTIEPNTYFGKYEPKNLPGDELRADMSDFVVQSLEKAGFEHYEISGYAKKGYQCRHNLNYWMYGDYLGIGPGAHGKITQSSDIFRTVSAVNPKHWLDKIEEGGNGFVKKTKVKKEDIPFEFMLNALRLKQGVDSSLWQQRTGLPLNLIAGKLNKLRHQGLLDPSENLIKATPFGWNYLNDLQEEFLSPE